MTPPLLSVEDASVTFPIRPRGAWPWTPSLSLKAVSDVSFSLKRGETLGIVGESGSGKSTLARAIIGTIPKSAGRIIWDGSDMDNLGQKQRRTLRRDIQMIFQDPLAALNPRMTVGEIVAEPLITHEPSLSKGIVRQRVTENLVRVGLLANQINRYPHEFSGGQCQRIGIARALILNPKLLICDEPVSALDVSVQAQVINLLKKLQAELALTLIFIAHDLSVVKHISDRIAVMYLGRLMETAEAGALINAPLHPYTSALVASVPIPDPESEALRRALPIKGELPSPIAPPSGCVFRTRCPIAQPSCAASKPEEHYVTSDHMVACPFHSVQPA